MNLVWVVFGNVHTNC